MNIIEKIGIIMIFTGIALYFINGLYLMAIPIEKYEIGSPQTWKRAMWCVIISFLGLLLVLLSNLLT